MLKGRSDVGLNGKLRERRLHQSEREHPSDGIPGKHVSRRTGSSPFKQLRQLMGPVSIQVSSFCPFPVLHRSC